MTETNPRQRSTPRGLDLAGRRMWKGIVKGYELRPDELFLLESACRTADTLAQLEAVMSGEPLMVEGSMGQMREHPLLSEVRQQRALLTRTLVLLKLPEMDAEVHNGFDRSKNARKAALSRWHP